MIAIVWFRRDLRLADNPALHHALESGHRLVLAYVLDQQTPGDWAIGGAGLWWLHHSLDALDRSVKKLGGTLVLRRGACTTEIPRLAEELGAATVHAGLLHEPAIRQADAQIAATLQAAGRSLQLHRGASLLPLDPIRTGTGGIYGVYGAFRRAVMARGEPEPPLPAPTQLSSTKISSDRLAAWDLLPTKPDWAAGFRTRWRVGELAGAEKLQHFVAETMGDYERSRNRPDEDGTSSLSPHLHWGEISPNQAWHAANAAIGDESRAVGLDRFRGELIWRDFAAYLLWHHPTLPDAPMRPAFAAMPWRDAPRELRAWQRGRTGVPIIDAGMRQLWQTGWMHNRIRMVVASYLIKHLLLAWQDGEHWFWDTLVDGDLSSNACNWQWVAGTGADPQPFFRIFNPVLQGQKFDPAGEYVRSWVPEIGKLPNRHIHTPWLAPAPVLAEAGVVIGKSYPAPLIDLAAGRARALAALRTVTGKADPDKAATA